VQDDKKIKVGNELAVTPDSSSSPAQPTGQTPVSSRRQAFDDVLRPLTPEDLASPGTQKIILYMLQQTQADNDELDGYVERFHDADKRAALLQQERDSERNKSKVIDIIIISGTTIGGALFGAGLYFIGKTPQDVTSAIVAFVFGILIVGGAIAARGAQR
jgi:hypothetical protein